MEKKDHSIIKFQPTNPHFFKPILPGCFSQLNIPSAFFLKYLSTQKKYEQAVLRTSHGNWTVKIKGPKFEDGWANFARENKLDIGDLLVFKLEENMVFNVVVFDPSACEKQSPQSNVDHIFEHGTSREKIMKKKPALTKSMEKLAVPRSDYPYFVSTVKRDCIRRSRFGIPAKFARDNGLDKNIKIILRDEKQRSWTMGIFKNNKQMFLRRGLSNFLKENGLKLGNSVVFELIRKGKKPVANFVSTRTFTEKIIKKKSALTKCMEKSAVSRSGYPYFVSRIKRDCINRCRFSIPIKFARENGLNGNTEIVLRDEKQRSWIVRINKNHERMYLGCGWSNFRKENGLKLGTSVTFELIRKGKKPIANFVPTS